MRSFNLCLFATIIFALSACAGNMNNLKKDETVGPNPSYLKLEQAQQTVALTLEYHDQGGYEKCAGLNSSDLH